MINNICTIIVFTGLFISLHGMQEEDFLGRVLVNTSNKYSLITCTGGCSQFPSANQIQYLVKQTGKLLDTSKPCHLILNKTEISALGTSALNCCNDLNVHKLTFNEGQINAIHELPAQKIVICNISDHKITTIGKSVIANLSRPNAYKLSVQKNDISQEATLALKFALLQQYTNPKTFGDISKWIIFNSFTLEASPLFTLILISYYLAGDSWLMWWLYIQILYIPTRYLEERLPKISPSTLPSFNKLIIS